MRIFYFRIKSSNSRNGVYLYSIRVESYDLKTARKLAKKRVPHIKNPILKLMGQLHFYNQY